jgi:hypothetical protein
MKPKQESRQKGLNLRLFAHISDKDEREYLMSAFTGSTVLFDKTIRKVLEDKLIESMSKVEREDIYELANTVMYLADQSGYRRAIKEVLALLPTNN